MKKIYLLFAALFCLLISYQVSAQSRTGADYFAGKWRVLIKEIEESGEDMKLIVTLEKKNNNITGVILDSAANQTTKIDSADVSDKEITIYFKSGDIDLHFSLKKKDEDHAEGLFFYLFDVVAVRMKPKS